MIFKRSLTLLISVLLIFSFLTPLTASAATETKSIYVEGKTYTHQDKMKSYTVLQGVDLSKHNGDVNFTKLKNLGTSFVILRAGYRGYGKNGTLCKDSKFDDYYSKAKAAGLKIGAYFYSQSLNAVEAQAEADLAFEVINGKALDLPVFFDYEFSGVKSGRLDSAWSNKTINKDIMTQNTDAFCQKIKNYGYVPGIYASTYFFYDNLNYTSLDTKYPIWDAHYAKKTTFKGNYQMWQYSEKGYASGAMSGCVDCNFLYKEALDKMMAQYQVAVGPIANQEYTSQPIKPLLSVSRNSKQLQENVDYNVTYQNNVNVGVASATVTGINSYKNCINVTKNFNIVPSKIKNIKTVTRTDNSIKFAWDAVGNATKYKIQILKDGSFKKLGTAKTNSFEIKNLQKNQTVEIRIAAIVKSGGKGYTGVYSDNTKLTVKIPQVVDVKSSKIKGDRFKLLWKKQIYSTGYKIYKYNQSKKKYECIKTVSKNSTTIKGLKQLNTYKIKIRAYKELNGKNIYGPYSKPITVTTKLNAPNNVFASSKEKKKINVKWDKNKEAGGYEVMWSTNKDFKSNFLSIYVNNKSSSAVINTYRENYLYYVRVRVYKTVDSKKVYSKWSAIKSVKVK